MAAGVARLFFCCWHNKRCQNKGVFWNCKIAPGNVCAGTRLLFSLNRPRSASSLPKLRTCAGWGKIPSTSMCVGCKIGIVQAPVYKVNCAECKIGPYELLLGPTAHSLVGPVDSSPFVLFGQISSPFGSLYTVWISCIPFNKWNLVFLLQFVSCYVSLFWGDPDRGRNTTT